jgi:hypothetical protein
VNPRYWILDGHDPIPVADVLTWGRWFETADRHVARDADEATGILVSTVFLGLDHSFGSGRPLLFESLVFADRDTVPRHLKKWDGHMDRYSTWAEAVAGHRAIVEALRAAGVR